MKRRLHVILGLAILLLVTVGCSDSASTSNGDQQSDDSGEPITIKTGLVVGDWAPHYVGLEKLKELVEEKSDGQIIIEGYPDGQLGGEREMLEGVQRGTLEMGLISSVVYGAFDERASAIDIPYLVTNFEEAEKLMDGPVGEALAGIFEENGMKVLSWGHNDFRIISNNVKPIKKPEDLNGIKMRTPENEVLTEWFEQQGALPTPLPFPDLYNALQQGVVDGQDNGPILTYAAKFAEIQKYLTVTNHQYSPIGFIINEEFFNSLSEEHQKILTESAKEAAKAERKAIKEFNDKAIKEIEKMGVEVTRLNDSQLKAFRESAKEIAEQLKNDLEGDFVNIVLEESGFEE